MASLIILGSAYPVFAAPKNVYTDADSGFAVKTANPSIEYASRHSYGFQENDSRTDSFNSVVAIPADVVAKKTGLPFSTKEFQAQLAAEMKKKSAVESEYALFRPETYQSANKKADYETAEDSLFDIFREEDMENGVFSYETKTVGKRNYYVISLQSPGAFDKEKDIDRNASDVKLYLTSENDILYVAESYCSAETEEAKKAAAEAGNKDTSLKETYQENGISMKTADDAMKNPTAVQKALLPLTEVPLTDPGFQKSLQKEREGLLKGLSFFKPDKKKAAFEMNDPVLKQKIVLPNDWLYLRGTPNLKDMDGVKLNIAWAAPHTMLNKFATVCMNSNVKRDLKPDEIYDLYDESVFFTSYSYKKGKDKNISDLIDEIFNIPQADMQKALDEAMPSLLNNENLKKYAVLSNTKANILNDGKQIQFSLASNVKVMDKYDFMTRGVLRGTKDKGLFSLYVAKGDKAKTEAVLNMADKVKLLPEK